MNRTLIAAFFGATLAATPFAATAAPADLVVLESNVASITPGSIISSDKRVSLKSGARIVMIASDGSTRSVTGPYTGAIGDGAANAPGALERLTGERDDSNNVVGAIRAPSWDQ